MCRCFVCACPHHSICVEIRGYLWALDVWAPVLGSGTFAHWPSLKMLHRVRRRWLLPQAPASSFLSYFLVYWNFTVIQRSKEKPLELGFLNTLCSWPWAVREYENRYQLITPWRNWLWVDSFTCVFFIFGERKAWPRHSLSSQGWSSCPHLPEGAGIKGAYYPVWFEHAGVVCFRMICVLRGL